MMNYGHYAMRTLILLLILHICSSDYKNSLLVKSYDEKNAVMRFYLIYYDDRSVYEIPDNSTLKALAHEFSTSVDQIPAITPNLLPVVLHSKGFLPSLLASNNSRIFLSELAERSLFFQDQSLVALHRWNPSVVYWHGRYLLCWRDGGKVAFGWLLEEEGVARGGRERAGGGEATGSNRTAAIDMKSYLGIGGVDGIVHPIQSGEIEQEDPRMLVLSDGRLIVTFTGFFPDPKRPQKRIGRNIQCFIFARYSEREKRVQFDEHIHKFDQNFGSNRQKNWVVFESRSDRSIYFIQQIQQMKIYKYTGVTDAVTHTAMCEEVPADSGLKGKGSLPWKSRIFGGHLRGGTPAILIDPKYYLQLFHTSFTHRFSEYFMGAMTFCSSPPFNIRSISTHPILRTERFYTGEFINSYLHYVVYPSGLLLHPADNRTLLVSFGHQDKEGYLVRMNLTGLLNSLSIIHHCE